MIYVCGEKEDFLSYFFCEVIELSEQTLHTLHYDNGVFLNKAELSLNSVHLANSGNLINH